MSMSNVSTVGFEIVSDTTVRKALSFQGKAEAEALKLISSVSGSNGTYMQIKAPKDFRAVWARPCELDKYMSPADAAFIAEQVYGRKQGYYGQHAYLLSALARTLKCSVTNCGISCRNDHRTAKPEFPIPRFCRLWGQGIQNHIFFPMQLAVTLVFFFFFFFFFFFNWYLICLNSLLLVRTHLLIEPFFNIDDEFTEDPRKSPRGCVPTLDKILKFWPEVPIYSESLGIGNSHESHPSCLSHPCQHTA